MKTLTLTAIAAFITILQIKAQQVYTDASFDPNKAFGIVDNQRTENDNRGFDFDLELGFLQRQWAWFVYYGAFPAAKYQNYGLGTDYQIAGNLTQWRLGVSLGAIVMNRASDKNLASGSWFSGNLRSLLYLPLSPGLGITGRIQFQVRPDIPEFGIFEGSLGVRILFR